MQLRITNSLLLSLVALFLSIAFLAFSPKVSAEEIVDVDTEPTESEEWIPVEDTETTIEVDAPYTYTETDGSVTFFENEEDYNTYLQGKKTYNPKESPQRASYEKVKSTLMQETKLSKRWVGYHKLTPHWSKATGYTLQGGRDYNASGTVSYNGYSATVSVTQHVSATVSFRANDSKYSRLGVRSDLTYRKWKHQVIDATGKVKKTYYTQSFSKRGAPYVAVVYQ